MQPELLRELSPKCAPRNAFGHRHESHRISLRKICNAMRTGRQSRPRLPPRARPRPSSSKSTARIEARGRVRWPSRSIRLGNSIACAMDLQRHEKATNAIRGERHQGTIARILHPAPEHCANLQRHENRQAITASASSSFSFSSFVLEIHCPNRGTRTIDGHRALIRLGNEARRRGWTGRHHEGRLGDDRPSANETLFRPTIKAKTIPTSL